MKEITKALIPAAGFGTRFLPQTKAMPKEMMPLVDKPIIQRVVEELVEAGIETIVIVTGWNKRSIEDHFDNNLELEYKLASLGKEDELSLVRKISDMAEFVYVRQKGPVGNATPILNVQHIMQDEPFMMFWGDDFIDATPSRARQLIEAYEKYHTPILGGIRVRDDEDYKKYGFAGGTEVSPGVFDLDTVLEKPGSRDKSPSDLGTISGFVFTKDIYQPLAEAAKILKPNEELGYLLGVQAMLNQGKKVHAIEIKDAVYHDTGNKLEYLKTVVQYGLKHQDISAEFRRYLISLIGQE